MSSTLYGDQKPRSSGGSPAGSSGNFQYNNAGAFAGSSDLVVSGGYVTMNTENSRLIYSTYYAFFDFSSLSSIASNITITLPATLGDSTPILHFNNSPNQFDYEAEFYDGFSIGDGTNRQVHSITITAARTITWPDASGTVALATQARDFAVTDSAKGLVLKDTQATPHYWRVTVSTIGVLTTTDIGTTPP